MTGLTTLGTSKPGAFQNPLADEGRRIDAAEYRELLVSRRSLVRVLSSVADVVGLRDTLTGETFLVEVDHLFAGRA